MLLPLEAAYERHNVAWIRYTCICHEYFSVAVTCKFLSIIMEAHRDVLRQMKCVPDICVNN